MSEENLNNGDNINENIDENISEIKEAETPEEPLMIIYKKEDSQQNNLNNLSPDANPIPPEYSYSKLTGKDENEKPGNQIYRWNINEEKNYKGRKNTKTKNKNKTRNLGIKIFAAVMSVMFLLSAAYTVFLFTDRLYLQEENNNDIKNNSGGNSVNTPVISNQDAVDETNNKANNNKEIEDTVITIPDASGSKILTTEEAIAKVNPSVVCIQTETEMVYRGFYGRNNSSYIQEGVGTGFIVSDDGYIATNYHVVSGADKITVTLYSGEEYQADFIGGDEVADLAIIKINAKNLPVAELGDSDALVQGQDVVAIGTPAGIEFAWSATKGIVSSISRDVDVNGQKRMTVIQIDASINPGNSGGPLINMKGQVIGINSMKLASTDYEGMGFAIPINTAIPVFNDIIANPGHINTSPDSVYPDDLSEVSFGLRGGTVTEEESMMKGIPQGWKIGEITEGGPCENSGLQLSDIIIALDGVTVMTTEDLYELKLNYKPGDKVTVTIYRNGDTYDFDIILAGK